MVAETNWIEEIGKPAYGSIADMVAALECDYDRLEELREEREGLQTEIDDACADHEGDSIDAKATISDGEKEAVEVLRQWDDDNAEELKELEAAAAGCDVNYPCESREDAEQRIQDDALSVRVFGERVNGEWEADKFELLLATGGPAVRIMGELDANCEPRRAWLEVQDWGKPWTHYHQADADTLLAYCQCFCFE